MSEDQDGGSSSGLMIGMIIGGVVVVALVVLGGFLLLIPARLAVKEAADRAAIRAEVAPDAADKDQAIEGMRVAPMGEGAPKKQPAHRLIGSWEGTAADGGRFTLHFKDDGKLEMDAWRKDNPKVRGTSTISKWTIVGEDEKHAKVRNDLIFEGSQPGLVHELHFENDHRFTVRSPRLPGDTVGRLAGGNLDGIAFTRRENPSGAKD